MRCATSHACWLVSSALALFAMLPPAPSAAEPRRLADSTIVDSWTLPSGLRVVTRHVPMAEAVAIAVCYPSGTDRDPEQREGLSSLLAEVAFTAPAGTVPERTRAEMDLLRPQGWMVKVTRRFTQLIENASYTNFPGVLHQVCERLRGVTVTEPALKDAVAQVRGELSANYDGRPERALHYLAGELSGGTTFEGALRYGSGAGLDRITARDAQQFLGDRFTPSSAVLSIAGNLKDYDVRRMLDHELSQLPGGDPAPPVRWGTLRSAQASLSRGDLTEPRGVFAVLAPELNPTDHPGFYRFCLLFGSYCRGRWGDPEPPLTTRFQYSLGDDPELARYYPPVTVGAHLSLEDEVRLTLAEYVMAPADSVSRQRLIRGVAWILGGPMPRETLLRARKDPATLSALCSNMAARAIYGDDGFWTEYLRRFETAPDEEPRWSAWFLEPKHQVQLLFTPAR